MNTRKDICENCLSTEDFEMDDNKLYCTDCGSYHNADGSICKACFGRGCADCLPINEDDRYNYKPWNGK